MPTTAFKIADWLIWFANDHGDSMTNLRLQKLLYYAQAWYLATKDQPLFNEDFQAWIHGPVIPGLYGHYKEFGSGPIVVAKHLNGDGILPEPNLAPEVQTHMNDLMESYGDLSAWQLERLTHQERPWIEARGGLAMDAPCKNYISKEAMRMFYKGLMNGQAATTGT